MPRQYPSDKLEIPGAEGLNVGMAREFLDGYEPRGAEDAELLVIAQGLRKLLHSQVDRNQNGHEILLEEAAHAAEVARRNAAVAAEINGPGLL